MRRRKKQRGLKALLVVLVIALIAVAALIIMKRMEYGASREFYEGLRGCVWSEGVGV